MFIIASAPVSSAPKSTFHVVRQSISITGTLISASISPIISAVRL